MAMKSLNQYILNESVYNSMNLDDLKESLLKLKSGDRIHALWGVSQKFTDATGKDRMVDYAFSIDKESKKYVICCSMFFKGHELLKDACKEAGISTWWSSLSGFAIRLDYEDMIKVLDVMPKFFNKYSGNNEFFTYLSFDYDECEDKCEEMRRPFAISTLEKEIAATEKAIKELESKKAQLQELKKAEANDNEWKKETAK